jgi:hypothetical protein
MMTFVFCVDTQMYKIKVRSSILVINSDTQEQMVEFALGCRFHDFNYFEVEIFFHILEFIIYSRASSQKFVNTHQSDVILSFFK